MVRLFVYGSLRRGARYNHLLGGDARWLRAARTAPRYTLLRMSWFPGLRGDGETRVIGDLYEVSADRLPELDEYEGPWFARGEVELEDGSRAVCWLVDPEMARDRPVIASGDFLAG